MKNTKDKEYDLTIYNEASLNLLNIHELREVGRKIGVPSPTMLSKTKLVEQIIKIASGEIEPSARSNYGRPSLNKLNASEFASKIRKNLEYKQDLDNFNLYSELKISPLSSSKKYKFVENVIQGVFKSDDEGNKILFDNGTSCVVADEIKEKLKLQNEDVLEAIFSNNFLKIISVNGIRVSGTIKEIKLFGEIVYRGEAKEFYYDYEEEKDEELEKFVASYGSKLSIILFSEKDFVGENVYNFKYDPNLNFSQIYKLFIKFLMICEEKLKNNNDFAIIIENKKTLENAFALLDDEIYERLKEKINDKIEINKSLGNFLIVFAKDEELIYPV